MCGEPADRLLNRRPRIMQHVRSETRQSQEPATAVPCSGLAFPYSHLSPGSTSCRTLDARLLAVLPLF
jgi:hypothetical protein